MYKVFRIQNLLLLMTVSAALFTWKISTLDYNGLIRLATEWVVNANPKTYLTLAVYPSLMLKLKYFSVVLLLLAVTIFLCRNFVDHYFNRLRTDFKVLFKDLQKYLATVLTKENNYEILGFLLIFALGLALRLMYINQPIRSDEALVFEQFAKQPLLVLVTTYHNVGNHIFHTLLLHLSWLIFGDSLWAIRLPVFLSGILLLPIGYLAVRALYGVSAAMITTAFIATSSALIEYSANSRGYSIQAFCILSLFALGIYLLKKPNHFAWALWIILTACGFWTVPTMFYAYGGLCLWFLISLLSNASNEARFKTLGYFIIANFFAAILTILLYSPVLIVYGLGAMPDMMANAKASFTMLQHSILSLKEHWLRNVPLFLQYPLLLLAALAMVFQYKISRNKLNLFFCSLLWLGISAIFLSPYALFTGFTRLWLAHSLFFYMAIGVGVAVICQWIFATFNISEKYAAMSLALILALSFSFLEWKQQYVYEVMLDSFHDSALVAGYLKNNLKSGDYVYAVCPYGSPLEYELGKLNCKLKVAVTKYKTGKVIHFSTLADPRKLAEKPNKERLLVISVPAYHGFVPSSTEMDDLIRGSNLAAWKKYNLRRIAHFKRTDIYEIDFSKLQKDGLIAKVSN